MFRLLATTALVLTAAAAAAQAPPPLIARDTIFGNPERTNPQISPDGKRLAYLAPRDGVMNVWVAPANDLAAARAVTADTKRGIRVFNWTPAGDRILFLQDAGGDENFQLFDVDLIGGVARDLSRNPKARIQIVGISDDVPDAMLIGVNDRDPRWHDTYRLDLKTGARTLVFKNDGFAGVVADDQLVPRFALKPRDDGGSEVMRIAADGTTSKFTEWGQADSLTTAPIGFDRAGKTLYMVDSRERDTAALVAVDVATGKKIALGEHPRADVSTVIEDPVTGRPLAFGANHLKTEWRALDDQVAADLALLNAKLPGEWSQTSQTRDGQTWVLRHDPVTAPLRFVTFDRRTKAITPLFTARPKLEGVALSPMYPRVIKSRDGLELVSYLTLPAGSDPDGDGRPDRPVPMMLWVHGGPWARDSFGFNSVHQWLANRGYAVLSVNFRGSTGLGKAFTNAGDRAWAGKMHDDLIDAVDWAVKGGVAVKDKVAIGGGSYGGYATLVGLTFTPTTFACGVDIVGPSNLQTLLATIPPYWASGVELFAKRVGDNRTPEGRKFLESVSPISRVSAIRRPLLIGQGANDPRVKQAESDQIVAAMQAKNIPVTYVLYPDEGHGFARPQNAKSFWAVTEAFLQPCLGGRVEPVGDDFQGATIQVKAGGERVPGVTAALGSAAR